VEHGGASKIIALLDAGIPLVESQKDLTPFQRTVILKELQRQQEETQSQKQQNQSPGRSNKLYNSQGKGSETVTYVNDGDS
jgi:hypothetical protein